MNIKEFEKKIGYAYNNVDLLKLALTHSSYGNEVYKDKLHNNERLEFLEFCARRHIERTLGCIENLFNEECNMPEGSLSRKRASIVCEPTLAMCAREINLPEVLFMGKGEELTGGRFRDSIVSDAMEAVIGSIYLDGGIECAREFINKFILADIKDKQLFVDSKTILQERIQAGYKEGPEYIITGESGPDHCKVFEAEVRIEGRLIGSGKGRTKKAAEQQAAYNAIMDMESKA